MPDPDGVDLFEQDAPIAHELRDLGPLMRHQAELDADAPDPEFMRSLRIRLVGSAKVSGRREVQPRPHTVGIAERHHVRSFGLGVVIALAAVLVVLFVRPQTVHSPTQSSAFALPRPGRVDLLRSYPIPVGQGGGPAPAPWSPTELPLGAAYPGRIYLRAGTLPHAPKTVVAYRLRGSSFDESRIAAIARLLHIRAPIKRIVQSSGTWRYARQPDPRLRGAGRSVAVSLSTGQLVYHDIAPGMSDRQDRPLNSPQNVAIARRWLRLLGWQTASMLPVVPSGQALALRNLVLLGWPGVGHTDTAAAAILVGDRGRVIDANVWPPVQRAEHLRPRSIQSAWIQVRSGKTPIGVQPMMRYLHRNGSGSERQVDLVEVLTRDRKGRAFLVPVYRFGGAVYFPGIAARHSWVALVPATFR